MDYISDIQEHNNNVMKKHLDLPVYGIHQYSSRPHQSLVHDEVPVLPVVVAGLHTLSLLICPEQQGGGPVNR